MKLSSFHSIDITVICCVLGKLFLAIWQRQQQHIYKNYMKGMGGGKIKVLLTI